MPRPIPAARRWTQNSPPKARRAGRGQESAATGKKESATGNKKSLSWSAPVTPGVGAPLGHLRLDLTEEAAASAPLESARALASSLAGMIGEMLQTRHALWQREAELAAGVPLVAPRRRRTSTWPPDLRPSSAAAREAVDCQAAALYLARRCHQPAEDCGRVGDCRWTG